jgi:tetratricopeptide (TPR) repeat protein
VGAARLYSAGLAKLREGNALAARDLLLEAVAADDAHALSHLALAQAWAELGYDSRAQEEAQRALARAGSLPREQRLSIEAYHYLARFDWAKAIKTYEVLFGFDPENLEYGLGLAAAQTRGSRTDAALQTLDRLEGLAADPPDPRIDLARSRALMSRGELHKLLDTANRAIERARARGADLLVARGEVEAAKGYGHLGRCDEVRRVRVEAEQIFSRVNDRQGIADLKNELARCLFQKGDYAGAFTLYDEVLEMCQKLGARRCVAVASNNSGSALYAQGRSDEALARFRAAIAAYADINDEETVGQTLANIALIHNERGELAEARQLAEKVVALETRLNRPLLLAEAQRTLGHILSQYGDLAAANRMIDSSAASARELGQKRVLADDVSIRSAILLYLGKLEAARRMVADAQRLYRELGDELEPAFLTVRLATIDLEEDNPNAAEAAVRDAMARPEKLPPDGAVLTVQAGARHHLVRTLIAQGKVNAARAEFDGAPASRVVLSLLDRQSISITQAKLEAAEGRTESAQRLLERVRTDAVRAHFRAIEFEARRAALEIRAAARGPDSSIRPLARALMNDASGSGFALVARKIAPLAD